MRSGTDWPLRSRPAPQPGSPGPLAAQQPVAELGSPATLARAFASELAILQARRVLLGLLLTGPLVGVWWLLLFTTGTWPADLDTVLQAIPVLPLVGLAIAASAATLATTGSLIRWLPEASPRLALLAAVGVGAAILAADLTVLSSFATRALGTLWQFSSVLAVVAVTASLIRVASTCAALFRCRRSWRALQAE